MHEDSRNIYKIARRAAGFTQEGAAERIGVSVESLRAYETDQRIPPNDIVAYMADCYHAPHLALQHLHGTNELARRVIPAIEQRDLLQVSIRIYNRIKRLEGTGTIDRLMQIAEDGIVDEDERPDFEAIQAELRALMQSAMELTVFEAPLTERS